MSQASIWLYFISACKVSFPWQGHSPYFTLTIAWFAIFHSWPLPDNLFFTVKDVSVVMMRNWFPVGWLVDGNFLVSVTSIHADHLSRECSPDAGSKLSQRRRLWPSIEPALAKHPCYPGLEYIPANSIRYPMVGRCWTTVYDDGTIFTRH